MPAVELATHEWPPARTDVGADTPVAVLVHGITGWYRTWWRVGPALADRGWRVVAVDQRGHGQSPRIGGRARVGDFADDLGAIVDRLGGSVDALVGHSLGAAAAIELAHRRPGAARRLVLEDPPAVTRVDDVEFQLRLEAEVMAARTDPAAEVRRQLDENPDWLPEDADQDVEGRAMADLEGILASLRADTGVRVLELAPIVTVPALYVLGAEGRSVMGGDARRQLLAGLPPASRAICMDAGHTVHRDRFDAYLEAVQSWLSAP